MTGPRDPHARVRRSRCLRPTVLAAAILATLLLARGRDAVHALALPATDAALARASAAAVRGLVVSVTGRRDPALGAIYTHVLLDVTRA